MKCLLIQQRRCKQLFLCIHHPFNKNLFILLHYCTIYLTSADGRFKKAYVRSPVCPLASVVCFTLMCIDTSCLTKNKQTKNNNFLYFRLRPLPCFCFPSYFLKKSVEIHTTRPIICSTKFLKLVTVVCLGKLPIQTG